MKIPKIKIRKPSKHEVKSVAAWIVGCVGMAAYGVIEHRRGAAEMTDAINDLTRQANDKGGHVEDFEMTENWNKINIKCNYTK